MTKEENIKAKKAMIKFDIKFEISYFKNKFIELAKILYELVVLIANFLVVAASMVTAAWLCKELGLYLDIPVQEAAPFLVFAMAFKSTSKYCHKLSTKLLGDLGNVSNYLRQATEVLIKTSSNVTDMIGTTMIALIIGCALYSIVLEKAIEYLLPMLKVLL